MKKIVCLFLILCSFFFLGCKENREVPQKISVEEVVINKSHAYVNLGERIILLAQVFPFNATNQNLIWKSDNENIATVDDGIVLGENEGRTVITAYSEDGNFFDNCIVFVSNPKLNYSLYPNNSNLISKPISNFNIQDESYFENINNEFKKMQNEMELFFENLFNACYESVNENLEDGENIEENSKGYYYSYMYSSDKIDDEYKKGDDIVYQDENTIIREKYF